MDIYLPIAGMSVNALLIIALGALVGLLSGMFGVGGGFLTTPLLIFYGIPPTVAVASATTQITGAIGQRGLCPLEARRGRFPDGRGDDRRRPARIAGRGGHFPPAPGQRPDRPADRLSLRHPARLDRRADAEGCGGRAWLGAGAGRDRHAQAPQPLGCRPAAALAILCLGPVHLSARPGGARLCAPGSSPSCSGSAAASS